MTSIIRFLQLLAAKYPHRFLYSIAGFIFALVFMSFGFVKTLIIFIITLLFYFFGLFHDRGGRISVLIKRFMRMRF